MSQNDKPVWITWEHQRRSVELSKAFDLHLMEISYTGNSILKLPVLSIKTILFLFRRRFTTIFVQNPSIMLAAVVCFFKKMLKLTIIVDRHSNFVFTESDGRSYSRFRRFFGSRLSDYSLKRADLTLVTNKFIYDIVEARGGRAFILQDKLPELTFVNKKNLKGKYNVVFPCTFSPDEPIEEVIRAVTYLDKDICIYITGSYRKEIHSPEMIIPSQIIFTGFLPEEDYQALLSSVDVVLVLTTRPHTLLCSAYESVAMCKPFVLSNSEDLVEYFNKGNIPTGNTAEEIADAILNALENHDFLLKGVSELKEHLSEEWLARFTKLRGIVDSL